MTDTKNHSKEGRLDRSRAEYFSRLRSLSLQRRWSWHLIIGAM